MTTRSRSSRRLRAPGGRDLWLALGLFIVLIVAAVLVGRSQQTPQSYDPESPAPGGTLALRLWLEDMGYSVLTTGRGAFEIPAEADLLLVFPGERPFSETEASQLRDWVASGHTLVLMGVPANDQAIVGAFGVQSRPYGSEFFSQLQQRQPLLPEAPGEVVSFESGNSLDLSSATGAVPVLVSGDNSNVAFADVAVQEVDQGTVWHLSEKVLLDNATLAEGEFGAVIPALLRTVPEGGVVVFDTFHLFPAAGSGAQEVNSLRDWLYRSASGRAVLFAGLVLFLFMVFQGTRLGPPLPSAAETRRRETVEYVRAMALLKRRARQRDSIAHFHKQRFKQGIGQLYHVRADLPDDEYLRQLQQSDTDLTPEQFDAIRRVIIDLAGKPDEAKLVHLVSQVDEILASMNISGRL